MEMIIVGLGLCVALIGIGIVGLIVSIRNFYWIKEEKEKTENKLRKQKAELKAISEEWPKYRQGLKK